MTEQEITLAEMFRVTSRLPADWQLSLTMTGEEAWFDLRNPDGDVIKVPNNGERTTAEMILAHVNAARDEMGLRSIDWTGSKV